MKNNVEEFLLVYKAFETACRSKGKEVRDLEDDLGENNPKMQQIRICRSLRNFCVHNDYTNFIQIHKGMIKFLKDETKKLEGKSRTKPVSKTTTLKPIKGKTIMKGKSKKKAVKGKSSFKKKK